MKPFRIAPAPPAPGKPTPAPPASAQPAPGAIAVNAALNGAGIETPFPQRDVTLRFPPRKET